jgi:pimeloyl-ACP methyl ester carboxylesterase
MTPILNPILQSQCVGLATHLYNFHPDRLSALILAAVPYFPPMSSLFDLDALIQHQHQTQTPDLGKPSFITSEYFRFFTADDAPQIFLAHLQSLWTVLHGYPQTWLGLWSVRDAMRDFLLADKRQPVMPYAATDEARKQKFFHRMRRDGFDAPLRWYRALTFGFQDEANAAAAAPENAMVVKCPLLFVCGGEDVGSRHEDFDDQVKAGLILDATKVVGRQCRALVYAREARRLRKQDRRLVEGEVLKFSFCRVIKGMADLYFGVPLSRPGCRSCQQYVIPILGDPDLISSQAILPAHQLKDNQPCTRTWNLLKRMI